MKLTEPKKISYIHAANLVRFTSNSEVKFNKMLNFSFMHSVFAVLLET